LIADSPSSYEGVALHLAQDKTSHAELKAKVERNRTSCALFDTASFTRHLEAAYSTMCENHRRGREPQSFSVPRSQT
jgi:predicted O-linked N-acetylglucosamine transferase (SPINDLY family)